MPAVIDKQKQPRFTPYARQDRPDPSGHNTSDIAQVLRAVIEKHSTVDNQNPQVAAGEHYKIVKDELKDVIEARNAEIRLEEKARREAELAEARRRHELDELNRHHQAKIEQARKERAKHSKPQGNRDLPRDDDGRKGYERGSMSDQRSGLDSSVIDLEKMYSIYFSRWDAIKGMKSTTPGTLAFYQLPWPILSSIAISADAITEEGVRRFYCPPGEVGIARDRTKLRLELRRWHPDKFNGLVLPKVSEAEKKTVSAAATCVFRSINSILKELY